MNRPDIDGIAERARAATVAAGGFGSWTADDELVFDSGSALVCKCTDDSAIRAAHIAGLSPAAALEVCKYVAHLEAAIKAMRPHVQAGPTSPVWKALAAIGALPKPELPRDMLFCCCVCDRSVWVKQSTGTEWPEGWQHGPWCGTRCCPECFASPETQAEIAETP
jgi:hypothetical protein